MIILFAVVIIAAIIIKVADYRDSHVFIDVTIDPDEYVKNSPLDPRD